MGFVANWFKRRAEKRRGITAREAVPIAREALEAWSHSKASAAHLCCVYTADEDSDYPVSWDGRCRAWHVDYYVPPEDAFYLVRIQGGRAKGRVRPRQNNPVEYVYATYGSSMPGNPYPKAIELPADWIDSPAVAEAAFQAAEGAIGPQLSNPRQFEDYYLASLCLPAAYIRYLNPESKPALLSKPAPEALCHGAFFFHPDADRMESVVVYVDASTGEPLEHEVFRFPALVSPGFSVDW